MLFDSTLRRDFARAFGATLVVLLTIVVTMMLMRTLGQAAGGVVGPQDVLLVLGFFADHASGYHGICGPYPTDIPAYPCGFGEYLENFANPFALAGLFAISIVAAVLTAGVLAALWAVVGGAVWLARALRDEVPSSSR